MAERFITYFDPYTISLARLNVGDGAFEKERWSEDLGNYCPIALLPQLSNIRSGGNQQRVAGFRRGYYTHDHIHGLSQILEKARNIEFQHVKHLTR